MNSNFIVIGLTRLGIKPESTAQETAALTTGPSEMTLKGLNCEPNNARISFEAFQVDRRLVWFLWLLKE